MTEFAELLRESGKEVTRIEANQIPRTEGIASILASKKIERVVAVDPTDDWLKRRFSTGCADHRIEVEWLPDHSFLTPVNEMDRWLDGRKKLFFTDFYMQQRKRLSILIGHDGKPEGGKWTFDTENRKKLPKEIEIPSLPKSKTRDSVIEAKKYVTMHFPKAIGSMDDFAYPVTHAEAQVWLKRFLNERLSLFGDYEDAISSSETFVFHSVLTPSLNVGLITPQEIVDAVLKWQEKVPMNSFEGFVRQVIGWREFIRMIYRHAGTKQRTTNYWKLEKPLPSSFYDGTTGILPVDTSIQRCLQFGYCHHIERLMVLGNFMLLCDIRPDEVYRWFMEMFVDSYDWVMVPNVYGMSQHADGGLMATKPYISGSSYIRKMSNFPKGEWCDVWDALYWRFVHREREFFASNPRMSMMVGQLDRMGKKLDQHLLIAEQFLQKLHGQS